MYNSPKQKGVALKKWPWHTLLHKYIHRVQVCGFSQVRRWDFEDGLAYFACT